MTEPVEAECAPPPLSLCPYSWIEVQSQAGRLSLEEVSSVQPGESEAGVCGSRGQAAAPPHPTPRGGLLTPSILLKADILAHGDHTGQACARGSGSDSWTARLDSLLCVAEAQLTLRTQQKPGPHLLPY